MALCLIDLLLFRALTANFVLDLLSAFFDIDVERDPFLLVCPVVLLSLFLFLRHVLVFLVLRLHLLLFLCLARFGLLFQVVLVQLLVVLHLLRRREAGGFDLGGQVDLRPDISLQDGAAFKLKAESLGEEPLDALDVSVEVERRIEMVGRCHLWEVDDCDVFVVGDHQIEFVEVAVDEAVLSELDDELYQPRGTPALG